MPQKHSLEISTSIVYNKLVIAKKGTFGGHRPLGMPVLKGLFFCDSLFNYNRYCKPFQAEKQAFCTSGSKTYIIIK